MRKMIIMLGIILMSISFGELGAIDFPVNTVEDFPDANPGDGICEGITTSDFKCSLRAAVMEANATPGIDLVDLPGGFSPEQPNTMVLTIPGVDEDMAATGDLDITESVRFNHNAFNGTLISTIDGGGIDRVFHVIGDDVNVEFETSIVIQNGNTDGDGGALLVEGDADVSFAACEMRANEATRGGAVAINNMTDIGFIALGGCLLTDNNATDSGGAGYANNGFISVFRSTISGNTALNFGGGLYTDNEGRGGVSRSTVTNNTASEGGGVSGSFNLALSILAANHLVGGGSEKFKDCQGDINNNSFSAGGMDLEGHNLIGIDCGITSLEPGNLVGEFDDATNQVISEIDPGLRPLADNGGDTRTHSLLMDSPAIDWVSPCASLSDQRLAEGPFGEACDIGAFELQASCGNGLAEEFETCDAGANNGSLESTCTSACTAKASGEADILCGNNQVDTHEACDDGNNIDDDDCNNLCQVPQFCGNGQIDPQESCDDGNDIDDDDCNNLCQVPVDESGGGCSLNKSDTKTKKTSLILFNLLIYGLLLGIMFYRAREVSSLK